MQIGTRIGRAVVLGCRYNPVSTRRQLRRAVNKRTFLHWFRRWLWRRRNISCHDRDHGWCRSRNWRCVLLMASRGGIRVTATTRRAFCNSAADESFLSSARMYGKIFCLTRVRCGMRQGTWRFALIYLTNHLIVARIDEVSVVGNGWRATRNRMLGQRILAGDSIHPAGWVRSHPVCEGHDLYAPRYKGAKSPFERSCGAAGRFRRSDVFSLQYATKSATLVVECPDWHLLAPANHLAVSTRSRPYRGRPGAREDPEESRIRTKHTTRGSQTQLSPAGDVESRRTIR